jgi:hypothetical protein
VEQPAGGSTSRPTSKTLQSAAGDGDLRHAREQLGLIIGVSDSVFGLRLGK